MASEKRREYLKLMIDNDEIHDAYAVIISQKIIADGENALTSEQIRHFEEQVVRRFDLPD
ncbi:hypothetical protein [Pararhizobium qamdonense]|uniref:hypothetical protein n=1 Tax=Pararhizobium qamdonense TaxID=3031126 RepID=UPI0023E0E719|nr:hypothetical protein [Pararhizobium qamdonense]